MKEVVDELSRQEADLNENRFDLLTALRENAQRAGRKSREQASRADRTHRWGVILAGGDGTRLRELTKFIYGDGRPKQFCRFLSDCTLLEEARRRAARSIDLRQIVCSVTRAHQDYYLHDLEPSQRIVQPANKGTAPAILSALLNVSRMDRDAIVAVLPSDHYYSRESAFTAALESAFAVAEARPASVVLLGAQPSGPEVEYGWIEVGQGVPEAIEDAFHVTRFHEKPRLPMAEELFRKGCLWNTFVMVGHVSAFLEMAAGSMPALFQALHAAHQLQTSGGETRIPDSVYGRIDATDFSRQVLTPAARQLVALSLRDAGWNDLGDPGRLIATLVESGIELPGWAARWRSGELASTAHCAS